VGYRSPPVSNMTSRCYNGCVPKLTTSTENL